MNQRELEFVGAVIRDVETLGDDIEPIVRLYHAARKTYFEQIKKKGEKNNGISSRH